MLIHVSKSGPKQESDRFVFQCSELIHSEAETIAAISQTTLSNAFSWMKVAHTNFA